MKTLGGLVKFQNYFKVISYLAAKIDIIYQLAFLVQENFQLFESTFENRWYDSHVHFSNFWTLCFLGYFAVWLDKIASQHIKWLERINKLIWELIPTQLSITIVHFIQWLKLKVELNSNQQRLKISIYNSSDWTII